LSPALPTGCQEIRYTISGQVKNARNGAGINGVHVRIEGTDVSATTQNGFFTLHGVPHGAATLAFDGDGLIKSTKAIVVDTDIFVGGDSDISMSPTMSSDQWRAVLKWAEHPSDLDTYLKWGSSKVCWYGRQQSSYGVAARLEHDDTTSFGPETIHVSGMGECRGSDSDCNVRYYVNDYTQTGGAMAREGAEVSLYTGERVAGSWKIKDCPHTVSADGNWWHVFSLNAKTNKLVWSCDMGDSSAALTLDFMAKAAGKEMAASVAPTISLRTDLSNATKPTPSLRARTPP